MNRFYFLLVLIAFMNCNPTSGTSGKSSVIGAWAGDVIVAGGRLGTIYICYDSKGKYDLFYTQNGNFSYTEKITWIRWTAGDWKQSGDTILTSANLYGLTSDSDGVSIEWMREISPESIYDNSKLIRKEINGKSVISSGEVNYNRIVRDSLPGQVYPYCKSE